MKLKIENIENIIGYQFQDKELLLTAITHKSYSKNNPEQEHNERLEFLGDAVLELVITNHIYQEYNYPEGVMTNIRSQIVSRESLANIGNKLDLQNQIQISESEKKELGHARKSIVSNCIEAVIGAIYIDSGYDSARKFVDSFITVEIDDLLNQKTLKDPKTVLQELIQKKQKTTPSYRILQSSGKDHDKLFECGVIIDNKIIATAKAKSKQKAEILAAEKALEIIDN